MGQMSLKVILLVYESCADDTSIWMCRWQNMANLISYPHK